MDMDPNATEMKDDESISSVQIHAPVDPLITRVPDPVVERRLVWKLDLIVLPLLCLIYFTHSLDRANLGNAKTDNFEANIGLKGMYHPDAFMSCF